MDMCSLRFFLSLLTHSRKRGIATITCLEEEALGKYFFLN